MSDFICPAPPVPTDGGILPFNCSTDISFLWTAQAFLGGSYGMSFTYAINRSGPLVEIIIKCTIITNPLFSFTLTYINPGAPTAPFVVISQAPPAFPIPSAVISPTGLEIVCTWILSSITSNTKYVLTFSSSSTTSLFDTVFGILTQSRQITGDQLFMEPIPIDPPSKVEVPTINIFLQFNIQGTNFSEAAFTIRDNRSYSCGKYSGFGPGQCKKRPIMIPPKEVITTDLYRSPCLNQVIRGKGCTTVEKITYLYNKYNNSTLNLTQFMFSIILYGLLKYILSYLLYGKFKTSSMLNNNDQQFFDDLACSRFCRFEEAFRSPPLRGKGRFFRSSCKG